MTFIYIIAPVIFLKKILLCIKYVEYLYIFKNVRWCFAEMKTGRHDLSPLNQDLLIRLCSHRAWWHTRPPGRHGTATHTHAHTHSVCLFRDVVESSTEQSEIQHL